MPLDYTHQLELLKDILTNQLEDCCGTISECEQLQRVIASLHEKGNLDNEARELLESIYAYSSAGKGSPDLDSHINTHRDKLAQWVGSISSLF